VETGRIYADSKGTENMAVKTYTRRGHDHYVIDLHWRKPDGSKGRYRRDAQIQTAAGAQAEDRRLVAQLVKTGDLEAVMEPVAEVAKEEPKTWADAVDRFKAVGLPRLKPSTRVGYLEVLKAKPFASWEKKLLSEITSATMQDLDAAVLATGCSGSRHRSFHNVVRSVLRVATEATYLAARPKMPTLPKVGRKAIDAFTTQEIDAILSEAEPVCGWTETRGRAREGKERRNERLAGPRRLARVAFALAAYAGLRMSEVRALRWRDVDLRRGVLVVREAMTGKGDIAPPKSGHDREIPIAPALLPYLAGRVGAADGFAAPNLKGKAWSEAALLLALRRTCERLGIRPKNFHAMRHYFITELFRRGAPAPAVQRLAGHHSLVVTQRYADFVGSDLQAAVALFRAPAAPAPVAAALQPRIPDVRRPGFSEARTRAAYPEHPREVRGLFKGVGHGCLCRKCNGNAGRDPAWFGPAPRAQNSCGLGSEDEWLRHADRRTPLLRVP
jgi:integrase